jgi:hypothetical protein
MSLQDRLDDVIMAHRENPNAATRAALAAAQEAWLEDFYRRQREEAIANYERRQLEKAALFARRYGDVEALRRAGR